MRNLLRPEGFIVCMFFCMFACSVENPYNKVYNQGMHIIPKPTTFIVNKDSFLLSDDVYIEYTSLFSETALYLSEKLHLSTGYNLSVNNNSLPVSGKKIRIVAENNLCNDEGYTLSVTKNGIDIKAKTNAGAFYAIQSLLQLLPAEIEHKSCIKGIRWNIPCVTIKDSPRFSYRGVMLDVCRHFYDVATVKRQIEVMAMLKINKLHLHLTENQSWRIEIKKYPSLIEVGGVSDKMDGSVYGPYYYTQEDLKEIIEYAGIHHIEVIPEIEFPGHTLAALAAFPALSCTGGPFHSRLIFGFERDVFCIGNDQVFEFMENVLSEVAAIFPSKYIHIGGDECAKDRWKACKKCQARIESLGLVADEKHSAEEKLQSYAIKRIEHYVSSKLQKQIIGWDEILEGGLAPGSVVMSWRGVKGGVDAAKQGHDVIMASMPDGYYMCDYQGAPEVELPASGLVGFMDKTYAFNPVPQEVPAEMAHHILGLQVCMWSEWALDNNTMEQMLYPRAIAMSEVGWTELTNKNYDDFYYRLANFFVRLDLKGINYHIPQPEGVLTRNVILDKDSVILNFTNTGNLPMVYTLDKSIPHCNSLVAKTSLVIKEPCVLNIATILPSGKISKVREIPIERIKQKPALECADSTQYIRLKIAEGRYKQDVDLKQIHFKTDTLLNSMSEYGNYKFDFMNPSLAVYEGYFRIPEDGIYTFTTICAELWVDLEQVIHNRTLARDLPVKKDVPLQKGWHRYCLIFNNTVVDGFANCWYPINFQYKDKQGNKMIVE